MKLATATVDSGSDGAGRADHRATPAQDAVIAVQDVRVAALVREALSTVVPLVTAHLASAPAEIGALLAQLHPVLVLVDLGLSDLAPGDLAAKVRALNPRARLVVIAGHGDDERILPALRGGAAGFLLAHDGLGEITAHLRTAVAGGIALTASLARQLIREADRTGAGAGVGRGDWEVLGWIAAGDTPAQCEARLRLADAEVLRQVQRIVVRMGLRGLGVALDDRPIS